MSVCPAELAGRFSFKPAEHPVKVACIPKAAGQRYIGDAVLRSAEHFGRALHPVIEQIVNGGAAGQLAENTAEIFGRQVCLPGQVLQREGFRILGVNQPQGILYPLRALDIPRDSASAGR